MLPQADPHQAMQVVLNRFPHLQPDRRGKFHMPCPWQGCSEEHFVIDERGCHCFKCGKGGSYQTLATQLGIRERSADYAPYVPPPPPPDAPWLADATSIVARTLTHPDRLKLWAAYKPLTKDTLDRHKFGVGKLPREKDGAWTTTKGDWLTVPLYEGDRLVGLRGRNLGDFGPKWSSASGSRYTLWNAAHLRAGATLWICENYVDAAWLMQLYDYDAVAIGGASSWKDSYTAIIAAAKPRLVIVALDNDLAGQAQGSMYAKLAAEFKTAHPNLPVPTPSGPKIANALLRAHVESVLYRWPAEAPPKADIGWLLAQREGEVVDAG